MNEKRFKGKVIYNPKGKAAEYAQWACNFYVGCSNGCEYCYLKKGILKSTMGMDVPRLKSGFKDEAEALECFKKELLQNADGIRKHGLFFSFTTDPLLEETSELTWQAAYFAMDNDVPVQILTKCVGRWVDQLCEEVHPSWRKYLAIGFTLTGYDEMEGNASSSESRIDAMRKLHKAGYKTFASLEPVVNFLTVSSIIDVTIGWCDLYKIGLMSGKKYDDLDRDRAESLLKDIKGYYKERFYLKDSMVKYLNLNRSELPPHFVDRDYNLFQK